MAHGPRAACEIGELLTGELGHELRQGLGAAIHIDEVNPLIPLVEGEVGVEGGQIRCKAGGQDRGGLGGGGLGRL